MELFRSRSERARTAHQEKMKAQKNLTTLLVATLGLTILGAQTHQAHAQQLDNVLGQIQKQKLEIVNVPDKFAVKVEDISEDCKNQVTLPRYPSIEQLECKLKQNTMGRVTRCADALPPDSCRAMNKKALDADLLKKDVADEANARGICVVSVQIPEVNVNMIASVCPVGCFEATTNILVSNDGDETQEVQAQDIQPSDRLAGLDKASSLQAPSLVSQSIKRITAGPEELPLFNFQLDNGRSLAVTSYHGMILSDGRVVHAKDVTINDKFLSKDGSLVSVLDISRTRTNLDVFNFELDVTEAEEHVVVAEDVMVGDIFWQFPDSIDNYSGAIR